MDQSYPIVSVVRRIPRSKACTASAFPLRSPVMRTWIIATVGALALTGCGGTPEAAKTSTATVTNTVTVAAPVATVPPAAPSPEAPAPEVVATTWTMPNLIGKNLQTAQNEIQRITNNERFFSSSTDLTGDGRAQIIDSNWQVCSSTPAPGEPITPQTSIDFGVVRIDVEDCP